MTDRDAQEDRLRSMTWFTAERSADGARLLLRGRRLDRDDYLGEAFPVVVTIEHRFEQKREDGLPTKQQHERYEMLFSPFTEAVEGAAVGLHVLGDTTRGLVREWFYVGDVKDIAALAKKYLEGPFDFDICYEDDPSWNFIDRAIDQIRGKGWEHPS